MPLLDTAENFQEAVSVKSPAVKLSSNGEAFGLEYFPEFLVEVSGFSCLAAGWEYEGFFVA